MKTMKKLMAVALVFAMMLSLAITAGAASITIARDDATYDGTGAGRTYNYYKVFSASYTNHTSSDGGYDSNGGPGVVSNIPSDGSVSYTATAAVAGKLGTWSDGKWVKATGNTWFELTPIAGSTNYSVKWATGADSSGATVQAAAKWLLDNKVYESGPVELTSSGGEWTSGNIDAGYYLIQGNTGNNLIAATTDITINEKNAYPPQDKQQKDEDAGSDGAYSDGSVDVAVGDVIDYQVTVTIPATAKVGDKILVWDKATEGLEYNNNVKVASNEGSATVDAVASSAKQYVSGAAWCQVITVTEGSQGNDVVFQFTMTVTSDALTDTGKANESGLKYGNASDFDSNSFPYESTPDRVEYKTYFAGIEKVDGQDATIKLEGVEFTLKEGDNEFTVSKPAGADYYVPDSAGSSTVITASDGTIKIRGLDKDKTYTLTETNNPNAGYNMLADPVTLTLTEDTASSTTYTPVDSDAKFDSNATYYMKSGDTYTKTTLTEEAFATTDKATLYTGVTTGTSSYDGTTADTWQDVLNYKGQVLPSTGGIGTKIFYAMGAVLVIGAGVMMVSKKRAGE